MQHQQNLWTRLIWALILLPIIAACGASESQQQTTNAPLPTPTLGQSFIVHPTTPPQPTPAGSTAPDPTVVAERTDQSTQLREQDMFVERPIYSTILDKNWSLEHSSG